MSDSAMVVGGVGELTASGSSALKQFADNEKINDAIISLLLVLQIPR
jgi:hypothetical protein